MKTEDLKHGRIYRLTRDVTNPKPDRRGRNFQRTSLRPYEWASKMDVWPAGMRFRYIEYHGTPGDYPNPEIENFDGDMHSRIEPETYNPKWVSGSKHERYIPNPKWAALVEALEPAPEDFDTFIHDVAGTRSVYIRAELLEILFEIGEVTKDQIRKAHAELERREAADEAAEADGVSS